MLLTADTTESSKTPFGRALLVNPNFWMLITITLLIIYPCTSLRLREVHGKALSEHCVKLKFTYRNVHYGMSFHFSIGLARLCCLSHPSAPFSGWKPLKTTAPVALGD
jgi:hypothetical protein